MYHHHQKYSRKYFLTKIAIFLTSYAQWLILTVLHVTISIKKTQWSRRQHAEYFIWRKYGDLGNTQKELFSVVSPQL